MRLEKYINEDLKDTYIKVSKKDLSDIKSDLKKLEKALNVGDIIDIRSASRGIESSANRIKERMGRGI